MPRRRNENMIEDLCLAVASGRAISEWAGASAVPVRTAYSWAATDEFKARVKELRREMTDRTIGRLTSIAAGVVVKIAKLADQAESEAVRLAALRALLSELVNIGSYHELAAEVEAIKEQFRQLEGKQR
jgi:hypothetical protein